MTERGGEGYDGQALETGALGAMDFSFRDALNTLQSDLSPAPSPEEPQETENSSDPLQDIWDTLDGNTDAEKDGNIDVEKDGNIDVSELLSGGVIVLQKLILASADEKNRANIASKLERALTHQIHTVIDTPGYLVSRADLYCFILYDSCIRGYTGLGAQFQSDFVSHGTIDQSLQTYILGDELTTFLFGSILEELASMPQSALFRRKYDFFVNQAKLCQPLFEEMMEKTFTIRKTCRYQPQLTQDQQNVLQRAQQGYDEFTQMLEMMATGRLFWRQIGSLTESEQFNSSYPQDFWTIIIEQVMRFRTFVMGVQEVIQKEMDMVLLAPTDPRHTIASGLADTLLAITESSSLIPTASHLDLLQDQQYQHYFAKVQELYTEKKTMNPSNDKIPLGAKQEAFDYLITNDRLFEEEAFTIDIPALRFGNAWTFGEKTIRVAQYATIPSSETTKTVYLRDEHTGELCKNTEGEPLKQLWCTSLYGSQNPQVEYYYFYKDTSTGETGYYKKRQVHEYDANGNMDGDPKDILVRIDVDFGSDQPLDPPKILLSEEIAKNFSFETAEAQAEKNHTSIPFASGDHLQDVLRSLLADDAVTIDDLICFVNNPYAEGSILDSVGDHIQHYWEQCGCSLTLDSEERKFVETAIVARIRKLSTARQGGQLSRLDKLKEYADQCTQPDSEITKEARQALVYNRVYGLLYQIDALSQAQEDSYPYKKEKQGASSLYDTIDKQELDTFVSDMTAKGLSAVSISPKTLLGLFNDNASTQLIQNSPLWADYTDKEANTISYPLVDQGLIDAFVASQETTKQRIIGEAKQQFAQSVLSGFFDGFAEEVTGQAPSSPISTIEIPSPFSEESLAGRYHNLGLYVDVEGVGSGNRNDVTAAHGWRFTRDLAIDIALTAVSGGVAGIGARRLLIAGTGWAMRRATLQAAKQGVEATISLADELYYYFKYMSLGAKTTRQGINIIGSVSELTLNSALFHTSNSILQGIRAGSDLPTILRQTVDVYGLLHSFVTLGVLKQFHTVTRGVIKPDISKLKHAFLQGGLVIPLEAVTLMGVDSGMQLLLDKKIKEEIMAMNDQTFFTRFLEMYAFILGLRAVHRPTHGLTKARQEALFGEMTKDPQITITGLSPLQFTIKDKQGREHPVNEENAYIPQVDTLQVRKNLETREHEKISRILEIIASPTKTEKQIKEVLELVLQIDIAGMNTSELQQMKDYFRDCLQANVIRALAKVLKKRLSGGRESLSIVQEMFQAIDNASGVRDRYQARGVLMTLGKEAGLSYELLQKLRQLNVRNVSIGIEQKTAYQPLEKKDIIDDRYSSIQQYANKKEVLSKNGAAEKKNRTIEQQVDEFLGKHTDLFVKDASGGKERLKQSKPQDVLRQYCEDYNINKNVTTGLVNYCIKVMGQTRTDVADKQNIRRCLLFIESMAHLTGYQDFFKASSFAYISDAAKLETVLNAAFDNAQFMIATFGMDFFAGAGAKSRSSYFQVPLDDAFYLSCKPGGGTSTFSVDFAIGLRTFDEAGNDRMVPTRELWRSGFDTGYDLSEPSTRMFRIIRTGSAIKSTLDNGIDKKPLSQGFENRYGISTARGVNFLLLHIAHFMGFDTVAALTTTGAKNLGTLGRSAGGVDYTRMFYGLGCRPLATPKNTDAGEGNRQYIQQLQAPDKLVNTICPKFNEQNGRDSKRGYMPVENGLQQREFNGLDYLFSSVRHLQGRTGWFVLPTRKSPGLPTKQEIDAAMYWQSKKQTMETIADPTDPGTISFSKTELSNELQYKFWISGDLSENYKRAVLNRAEKHDCFNDGQKNQIFADIVRVQLVSPVQFEAFCKIIQQRGDKITFDQLALLTIPINYKIDFVQLYHALEQITVMPPVDIENALMGQYIFKSPTQWTPDFFKTLTYIAGGIDSNVYTWNGYDGKAKTRIIKFYQAGLSETELTTYYKAMRELDTYLNQYFTDSGQKVSVYHSKVDFIGSYIPSGQGKTQSIVQLEYIDGYRQLSTGYLGWVELEINKAITAFLGLPSSEAQYRVGSINTKITYDTSGKPISYMITDMDNIKKFLEAYNRRP